jgi:glycosyltransferase involved in cell wall biosynthesis
MASGIPVVTSTWGSLIEVTGDAGLHADAQDYDGLADHVVSILEDSRCAEELRRKGLERARMFSWEATAKQVYELYREIGAEAA